MAATIASPSAPGTNSPAAPRRPSSSPVADLEAPPLERLLRLDDHGFRALFAGSPVKRIGRDRFLRNVLIAAGNSGDAALLPCCLALTVDPSALVRGAAAWAVWRLAEPPRAAAVARARLAVEADAAVRAEWLEAA